MQSTFQTNPSRVYVNNLKNKGKWIGSTQKARNQKLN